MHNIQLRRDGLPFTKNSLNLHHVFLQITEAALEKHFASVHNSHMVADIFQFAQIVGGNQHCRPSFRHISQKNTPDLTAHQRVKPIHRLVKQQKVRRCGKCQPESRLLLHAFTQLADQPFGVNLKGRAELFKALFAEMREHIPIQLHHVMDRCLRIEEHFIGDIGDTAFQLRIFKYFFSTDQNFPAVLPQDSGKMPDRS